jgi:hypothetical protein
MATTVLPFWMQQRQVKAEPINETTLKISAPQLPTYEIEIRPIAGTSEWTAAVHRAAVEGSERRLVAEAARPQPHKWGAWEAGFELYRQAVVV